MVEIKLHIAIIGMAVVPTDERCGRGTADEFFARDAHFAVRLGADGVNNLIVVCQQLIVRNVLTDGHIAKKAHAWVGHEFVVDTRHTLD